MPLIESVNHVAFSVARPLPEYGTTQLVARALIRCLAAAWNAARDAAGSGHGGSATRCAFLISLRHLSVFLWFVLAGQLSDTLPPSGLAACDRDARDAGDASPNDERGPASGLPTATRSVRMVFPLETR